MPYFHTFPHTYSRRLCATHPHHYEWLHHPQGQRSQLVDLGILALTLLLGTQVGVLGIMHTSTLALSKLVFLQLVDLGLLALALLLGPQV